MRSSCRRTIGVRPTAIWFSPRTSSSARHPLTEHLKQYGGNIGYNVHPGYRNRGMATWALRAALQMLAAKGWFPDGGTLAISADRGTGAFAVWVVAADGSNARPITNDWIYAQPFSSPDGKSIAVSAKIDESYRRIYIMAADGSDRQRVKQPEDIDNVHPAWSPDGRSIVFTSGTGIEASLFILDLAWAVLVRTMPLATSHVDAAGAATRVLGARVHLPRVNVSRCGTAFNPGSQGNSRA
jgi:hypothetical protein